MRNIFVCHTRHGTATPASWWLQWIAAVAAIVPVLAWAVPSCNNACVEQCAVNVQCVENNGAISTRSCQPAVMRPSPDNTHYFEEYQLDANQNVVRGQPKLIASYSFANIVPEDKSFDCGGANQHPGCGSYPANTPGYKPQVAQMAANKVQYSRLWHWSANPLGIMPWGKGTALPGCYGGERYQMQPGADGHIALKNPTYWNRMNEALDLAKNACITTEVMLLDGGSLSSDWPYYPWASNNNINQLATPVCASVSGLPSFYCTLSPNEGCSGPIGTPAEKLKLLQTQQAVMRDLVDVGINRNPIYEIENESQAFYPDWFSNWSAFLKNYMLTTYPGKPTRLTAFSSNTRVDEIGDSYIAPAGDWSATQTYPQGTRVKYQVGGFAYKWTYICVAGTCAGGNTPDTSAQWYIAQPLEIALDDPNLDIVNRHISRENEKPGILNSVHTYIASRWKETDKRTGKAINIDEFANHLNCQSSPSPVDFCNCEKTFTCPAATRDQIPDTHLLRKLAWTIVTSGGHFHIEDTPLYSTSLAVTRNIHEFLQQSGWEFVNSYPEINAGAGGPFCMRPINPAATYGQYVCYFTTSGTKSFNNVAAGSYAIGWWNPRTGGWSASAQQSVTNGVLTVTAPSASDWVVMIRKENPAPAAEYYPVPPCRVADTRDAVDGPALAGGTDRMFQIAGECGVPATATAVMANLTVTRPSAVGYLTVYPAGDFRPAASSANFRVGETRANTAVVGPNLVVYAGVAPGATVDLIVDVVGYFQ